MNQVATIQPTHSQSMQALVPRSVPEAIQLSETLASASLVPEHLRNKPGDCLLIVMQAQRWGMDVLSVAQCTSIVRGKLCYEGKLVAAVLYSMGAIEGRLSYAYTGTGSGRSVTVAGTPRGMKDQQTVTGSVADWSTANDQWKKSPDDMLCYRGTRQWARRYAPEALLGVYTPDEIEELPQQVSVVQGRKGAPKELQPYPDADFEKNLSAWRDMIDGGKTTADAVIAKIESKATLTDAQKKRIADPAAPIDGECTVVEKEEAA